MGHSVLVETPIVSVLVPCWNAERSISAALGSVLDERSVALECVVVDDGSTDHSLEILKDIAARDPRVVVVALPANAGVSNARNEGLARVRGTWLTMLDADDRFLPGGIARLVEAATATDARAVVGQQLVTDGRRRWLPSLYDVADLRRPGRRSLAANPGLLNSVSPHAKLFHRSCFDGLTFFGRVLGDQPWIIRALIRAGGEIEVIGDTVYLWHRPAPGIATGSITSTTRSSAQRSVAAVEVAVRAVGAVGDEAAALGPTARDAIVGAYVDRLLRADLGPMLARSLARRDPGTAELLDAVTTFVAGVRPADLAASPSVCRELIEPALRGWRSLDAASEAALGHLIGAALQADPACLRRRPPLARLGVAISRGGGAARRTVGSALLTVQWALDRAPRLLRRVLRLTGRR